MTPTFYVTLPDGSQYTAPATLRGVEPAFGFYEAGVRLFGRAHSFRVEGIRPPVDLLHPSLRRGRPLDRAAVETFLRSIGAPE